MTKPEFTKENIQDFKACIHKAMLYFCEKTNIDTKRIKEYYGVSQSKLGVDFHCNFVIENKKKDE